MEPAKIRFGGGASETILHPLVLVWMLVAIVLILTLPRQKALVPFFLAFFTIPLGQVILVGGLHFTVLRILIVAALLRRTTFRISSDKFPGGVSDVDRLTILWLLSGFVIVSLQWMELQALIKFLGDLIDMLGGYLAVRCLIPDRKAVQRTVKVLALVCLIQGACMINEKVTRTNIVGYLGGMSVTPVLRDGHVRANGVMGTLYGGVFAGVLMPIFLWLWTQRRSRLMACVGLTGASAMVYASGASTSWIAYGAGLGALACWPLRGHMRLLRWCIAAVLVALQVVMNGPVWWLIAKIDIIGGSSSYHRYLLIDTLFRHFSAWWLLGTRNNGSWGWEMWDTCNQFVATAVTGGLLTLVLYIMILKNSFAAIGNARKQVRGDRAQEWLLWCLGSCLFANVIAQFGINYMIQLLLVLFPLLAWISVTVSEIKDSTIPNVNEIRYNSYSVADVSLANCPPLHNAH